MAVPPAARSHPSAGAATEGACSPTFPITRRSVPPKGKAGPPRPRIRRCTQENDRLAADPQPLHGVQTTMRPRSRSVPPAGVRSVREVREGCVEGRVRALGVADAPPPVRAIEPATQYLMPVRKDRCTPGAKPLARTIAPDEGLSRPAIHKIWIERRRAASRPGRLRRAFRNTLANCESGGRPAPICGKSGVSHALLALFVASGARLL